MVCPHAAIRAKVVPGEALAAAPAGFKAVPYRGTEYPGQTYTLQVAPEDCTGCTLCVMVCPAKDKANPRHKALGMEAQAPLRAAQRDAFAFFLDLPEADRTQVRGDIKGVQLLEPLFEFSGACAGCGETPYLKLMSQLFGDRALVANATGCSSIYGGNLPTTPWTTNRDGRGPAWANALFEDNAEFGLGMRLALDHHRDRAEALVQALAPQLGDEIVAALLSASQDDERGIAAQRERVALLRSRLAGVALPEARLLDGLADYLVRKSVWIVGGDGWAYDIGFGGLDHVLSLGADVNVLVLDTEVYSNTGGQQSKATPLGASAKFAVAGKATPKKDLGLMAMSYGSVYVAHVAFGAKDQHTVRAFQEAESFPGPSLVIAYSHCIAHGYDLAHGLEQQKLAVGSGYWPLYRWDPRRIARGETPLQLDSGAQQTPLVDFLRNETRFRVVEQDDPQRFKKLVAAARSENARRFGVYEDLARLHLADAPPAPAAAPERS
jgi:pyruvate-ferredoxin/flavodoxin oxidoreductase